METQTNITSLESEQENPSDDVANCTLQVVAYQPLVDLDDDPFVIPDIPGSDDGWIENTDEEVPALRKLDDVEDESFDDVDNDSEFHYDESFLSTADDCAEDDCTEDILGNLNSTDEMANETESTANTDVYSSPQRNASTSVSKASFVKNQSFTVNSFQDSSEETDSADEGEGDDMFYGDNVSKHETTSQRQQINTLVDEQSHEAKDKEGIEDSIESKQYCAMEVVPKNTRGSSMSDERLQFTKSKKAVLVSALPTRGVKKSRRRKTGGIVSYAFDVKDGSNRLRQTQVSKPREKACESETEKPGTEEFTKNPDLISPMPTSQMCTSEPTQRSTPSPTSTASKSTIKPRTLPLKLDVKGVYLRDGLSLTRVSTSSTNPSVIREETRVGREGLAGEYVDCKGLNATRITDVVHKNSELKATTSESLPETSSKKQYLFKVQSGSKADGSKTSSLFSGGDESPKKHYTSVDEYVEDLKRMMKQKGIRNMVLQGPKQVIEDVTKKLNGSDTKKVLFRLGGSQTPDQQRIDSSQPLLTIKKSAPASCATPSVADSQNEPPSKRNSSNTANISEESAAKDDEPSELSIPAKCASSTPEVIAVKDSLPVSVGNIANEAQSLPATSSTDVFKALSMLKLGQPHEDPTVPLSAPISRAPTTDHAIESIIKARMDTNNPTAGNTVIDGLEPVIPSSLTHAPPSTDQRASTQQAQNATLEETKTVTAGCDKPLAANVAYKAGEGQTIRITRSMSRASTQTPRKSVKDLDRAMSPPLKLGDTTSSVVGDQDGVLRFGAPSRPSSSMLPYVINTSDKMDGNLVRPCVPFVGVPKPTTSAPLLQPKRTNLVRYVVLGPNGQRKILQVPGGIPVLVSKALSGQPPMIYCKPNLSVGVDIDNSVLGDKEVVDVRTEVLPSGAQVKIVRTRTKSSSEHVERNVRTDPNKIVISGTYESPKSGKNIVSNHDGSYVFTQKSTTAINRLEKNPTEIARDHDKTIAKQLPQSSEPRDEKGDTCGTTENIGINSPTPRRSRRERKVTRPYSPPPQKRRKVKSSPSSSNIEDSSAESTCSYQQPSPKPSACAVVVLKKEIKLPHLIRLSDNTKVECIQEEDGKRVTRTPKKGFKIRIKSEPLSDDEPRNPAEPSPNLAESKTIKPEPDTDSDSTDIPTDPEDTDDGSCHSSANLTGLLADTRSVDWNCGLPKVSDTEYLSRDEKMRLLKQQIEEQESMLENIQIQRHQQVMQRQNNPYLEDLF